MNSALKSSDASYANDFKNLQLQFINWATQWFNTGNKTEQQPIDLPNLVQLLQVLGFHIRRMDGCCSEDTCPLRENEKGIRVVVTCNHSGHRCYLEKPVNANACKCTKISTANNKNCFWEIANDQSSSDQNLKTENDLIPMLPIALKQIICPVMNYLLYMMRENNTLKSSLAENDSKSNYDQDHLKQLPQNAAAKVNLPMSSFMQNPVVVVTSQGNADSPTKYRSLDTLIASADNGFLESSSLAASYYTSEYKASSALSTPNVHLVAINANNDRSSTAEEIKSSEKALTLMKNASRDLLRAITLIEANSADVSLESVFDKQLDDDAKNITPDTKSLASPRSTLTTKSVSSPNLSKPLSKQGKQIAPKPFSKSVSTACAKNALKDKKTESKTNAKRNGSLSSAGDTKLKIPLKVDLHGQGAKHSGLYAHIKSTIPKAGFLKKK